MGFSLASFFQELEKELDAGSIFTIIPRLRKLIAAHKKYAKECGLLE